MVRFALLGCAAFGLALSSPAQAEDIASGAGLAANEAAPVTPKPKRILRSAAVLPPARPAEAGEITLAEAASDPTAPLIRGSQAPLPAQFQGPAAAAPEPSTAIQAPMKVAAVATLPPLRPAFATEAAAAPIPAVEPEQSEAGNHAAPIPPARPDFAEVPAPELVVTAILPPERPAIETDAASVPAAAQPSSQPAQPRSLFGALFGGFPQPAPAAPAEEPMIRTGRDFLDERIAHHAKLNGVPAALVHRVVVRESKYNPRAIGRGGAMGLMQIKTATARGLGYEGTPAGLLDAETNLTYAVKYLAGAYRLADGSFDRAVQHYARGYYYEAKRRNARLAQRSRSEQLQRQADAAASIEPASATASATPRSLFNTGR